MSDRSEELHRKVWEVRKQMLLEELICQIGCTENFSDWYDQAKRKGKSPEEWVAFSAGQWRSYSVMKMGCTVATGSMWRSWSARTGSCWTSTLN